MKKEYLVCDNCGKEMYKSEDADRAVEVDIEAKDKVNIKDINLIVKVVFNNRINYIRPNNALNFCSLRCQKVYFEELATGKIGNTKERKRK